jgi:hypothetical protein
MKAFLAILTIMAATIAITYLNFWQIKNIDTAGKLFNRDLILFLLVYGLLLLFFINPALVMGFRLGFSAFQKSLIPQFVYQATAVISPLIIAWMIFQEMPQKGTLVAAILSVISIFCVIFWR